MKNYRNDISPCRTCVRVRDPENCENKRCNEWRRWFLRRWDLIHSYPRRQKENAALHPAGFSIGGVRYCLTPREPDPCIRCACDRALCATPCRVRKAWAGEERGQAQ